MTTNVEAIKITGLGRDPLRGRVTRLMTEALAKLAVPPVKGQASFFDDNGPKGGRAMRCALTVRLPFRPSIRVERSALTPRLAFDATFAAPARAVPRAGSRQQAAPQEVLRGAPGPGRRGSASEMKSKKEALDDAISATKAAVAEGIVPGGGLALLRVIEAVEREESKCDGDERTGLQILRRALETPTRQIAENSSVDGGVVVNQMRMGRGNMGFDAARKEYVDLVEAGIIDPTKVVRVALENAVSVASLLLLTEATLTEVPEKKDERAGAHGLEDM
jgi:hypothetical protein